MHAQKMPKQNVEKIPPTQAAYQQGRSTTEMVFGFRAMAQKAITSKDLEITLLLLDMSDTVKRKDLFEILKEVLDYDELKLLGGNVTLQVKVGKKMKNQHRCTIGRLFKSDSFYHVTNRSSQTNASHRTVATHK